jgi:hypothetical protein
MQRLEMLRFRETRQALLRLKDDMAQIYARFDKLMHRQGPVRYQELRATALHFDSVIERSRETNKAFAALLTRHDDGARLSCGLPPEHL